jgi:hypothetical protein
MPIKTNIKERAEHVKDYVNNSPKTSQAVKELAKQLFLKERTIWDDLKR